jgi:UDP:flavonoid glycosyltransferase YjiC (YdhE family)
MAKFLFTMLAVNDLGLPTRLVPIARVLADRGHDVAVFNPAPAPAKLIEDAGLINLPMPSRPMPAVAGDLAQASTAWDVEEMFAHLFSDEDGVRAATAVYVDLVRDYAPDIVVDSFGLFPGMAARILGIPLASVLQGNFHPASDGFLWWKGERPAGLPSPAPAVNKVLAEYGVEPVERSVDLLAGDLSLITGTPETDPVSPGANVAHVGQIIWQRGNAVLPDWITQMDHDKPLVWVYCGNPRYAGAAATNPFDSIVVMRAAIAALGDAPMHVVLTTGYQDVPEEIGALPSNFHQAAYLPGLAMSSRCDLMVHHGGHSSVMTGFSVGTPAVIIPTSTERESNARRVVALGAGEIVLPMDGADGEKHIDVDEFGTKVRRVLSEPGYRQSARRVAESMRQFGGAPEAADRIERFAGYKS